MSWSNRDRYRKKLRQVIDGLASMQTVCAEVGAVYTNAKPVISEALQECYLLIDELKLFLEKIWGEI